MVATLYHYAPASDKIRYDGIVGVISNQDSGDTAAVRLAAVLAQVQTLHNVPAGHLVQIAVLGLPTGGDMTTANDVRIYHETGTSEVIA